MANTVGPSTGEVYIGVTLLDPTAQAEPESLQLAARPDSLSGKRLGLIENTKQNAGDVPRGRLRAPAGRARAGLGDPADGPGDGAYASDSLLDELARECDLVIEAVGD